MVCFPPTLDRGGVPRSRSGPSGPGPHPALLCCSLPTHFSELVRVARLLEGTGEFAAVFWLQMLPHKLEEAARVCEAEGYRCFQRVIRLGEQGGADAGPGRWLRRLRDRWRKGRAEREARPPGAVPPEDHGGETAGPSPEGAAARRPAGEGSSRGRGRLADALGRAIPRQGLPRSLRRLPCLAAAALVRPRDLRALLRHYRRELRQARATLAACSPDIILIAEDALYDYAALVVEGRRRGIPSVVVPYTISTASEPAEAILSFPDFREHYSLESGLARLTARCFPQWVHAHKGQAMLRLRPLLILALEYLDMAPPRPWVFNSGHSVALAAESEHMASLYLSEGLPPEYVVVTGALYDDRIAEVCARREEERRALLSELGLPPSRRIVLCSLPPRMELERRPGCEFAAHQALAEFMVSRLCAAPDSAVVVSLHPTLQRDEVAYVEALGGRISSRNIAELVPLADLFVACISATIRIAIACGVPVLNYDVFRYGYRDYEGVGGVVTVTTRAEYAEAAARAAADPRYAAGLRRAQEACAARWGFRDGRSGERMLALFRHVIAHGGPRGFAAGRPGRAAPSAVSA